MGEEKRRPGEAIYAITRPHKKLLTLYLLRSFAGLAFMPFVFLPLFFKYQTLKYRFDEKGITMSWGILFRRETFLTYGRIQDIHLTRGIIERWLGLGTIDVQTASGSSGAEMSIVGLEEHEAVRDFLYARMRGTHRDVQTEPSGDHDEVVELLRGIRDDLRALRARLDGEAGHV